MAGSLQQIVLYTKGEDCLFTVVNSILASKNDLQFCVRVLARIIGAVDQGNRVKIDKDMSFEHSHCQEAYCELRRASDHSG